MKRLTTLTTVVLFCLGSNVLAQQKQQVSFKVPDENVKLIVSENVDVGDVPNHIVRLFNAHYTLPNNAATINGLKLVEAFGRGTGDLTNLSGAGQGYFVFVAENGDKLFARGNFVTQNIAGGKLTTTTWVAHIMGGTGKLAGLQGITRLVLNIDPSPGGVISGPQFDIEYSIGK